MKVINTHSAKAQPVAKLVLHKPEPRKPGRLKGKIRMADDFDEPLPESLMAAFRGAEPISK